MNICKWKASIDFWSMKTWLSVIPRCLICKLLTGRALILQLQLRRFDLALSVAILQTASYWWALYHIFLCVWNNCLVWCSQVRDGLQTFYLCNWSMLSLRISMTVVTQFGGRFVISKSLVIFWNKWCKTSHTVLL